MTTNVQSSRKRALTLVGWLRVFVFTVCISLAAAFAYYEWSTREALLEKAENDAVMLAGSLGQHAQDTLEMVDVVLTGAADRIAISDRSLADLYAIDEGLARQLRQAWRIRSIMAFDEAGHQFVSSQPQVQDWFSLSGTNSFELHAKNTDPALRIGAPAKSPTNDDWIVPITRRLDKPDGSFGGILVATIRVNYFTGFYKSVGEASSAIISLLSRDGKLLSRYPLIEDMIGSNVARGLWQSDVLKKSDGTLRFSSPVDAVDRVYGFTNTPDYPLVVFVGLSRETILAGWLRDALIHLIGAAGLIALFAVIGMKLAKHVGLRQSSEREFAKLARIDGLTGVMNRRSFDEVFRKAWLTAASSTKPLSLLLLDVDHFKAFNDTYGHPAGDTCLQIVASAMIETVYKPADRVARYGGEEFAVLLPDTGEASAQIVAERIRMAIEDLALPNKASSVQPTLTVSIGVATHNPGVGNTSTTADFLSDADRALYKAKFLGRNQVQSTRPSLVPLSNGLAPAKSEQIKEQPSHPMAAVILRL